MTYRASYAATCGAVLLVLACGEHRTQVGSIAGADQSERPAPTGIPGVGEPLLWLDATQLPTTTGALDVWPDASSHHHDGQQQTPELRANYTLNGIASLPGVSFDGMDDHLTIPNQDGAFDVSELTVMLALAAAPNPAENNPSPFGIREESAARISIHVDGNLADFHSYNGVDIAGFDVPLTPGAGYVMTFRWAAGRQAQYLDGVLVAEQAQPLGTAEQSDVQVGNSHPGWEPFAGTIGEVVVFDRALSDAELAQLHAHAARWLLVE